MRLGYERKCGESLELLPAENVRGEIQFEALGVECGGATVAVYGADAGFWAIDQERRRSPPRVRRFVLLVS